eukprot:1918409-Rhodomonas_salina.1
MTGEGGCVCRRRKTHRTLSPRTPHTTGQLSPYNARRSSRYTFRTAPYKGPRTVRRLDTILTVGDWTFNIYKAAAKEP